MKEITATEFRQNLFANLDHTDREPVLIKHRKKNKILMSYQDYQKLLKARAKSEKKVGYEPLLPQGRIIGELNEETDRELRKYMGYE